MILVRNVFQLKFGKAREAKALVKEGTEILKKGGPASTRWLTDLTGPFYMLVMESTYENLAALENSMKDTMSAQEFAAWYQKFTPLVESGSREIYSIVE
ncbi:MAG TPA: hypothetical protein DCP63_06245 [Bacteroidetes bacterium]|nr:hypothetical protein [Bacteroidota bacterium]